VSAADCVAAPVNRYWPQDDTRSQYDRMYALYRELYTTNAKLFGKLAECRADLRSGLVEAQASCV
jgi:sugar (pentulose or hexulose) kinase